MTPDLTKSEIAILRMLAGETDETLHAGAGVWTSIEYLRRLRLVQIKGKCRTTVSYELSREGRRYLERSARV